MNGICVGNPTCSHSQTDLHSTTSRKRIILKSVFSAYDINSEIIPILTLSSYLYSYCRTVLITRDMENTAVYRVFTYLR